MISKLHTACRGCIFAEINGKTQVGCKFNRIDKYKETNYEVLEVYDQDNNEFFVINDAVCSWKRSNNWTGLHLPKIEQESQIAKESQLSFHVFVGSTNDIDKIAKTIEYINAQTNKPKEITFIRSLDCLIRPPQIQQQLDKLKSGIIWHISNITDEDACEDDIIAAPKHPFFIYINAGEYIPDTFIEDINRSVNFDMLKFIALLPNDNGHGLVGYSPLYHLIDIKKEFVSKLKDEEICKAMIFNVADVSPNFPA